MPSADARRRLSSLAAEAQLMVSKRACTAALRARRAHPDSEPTYLAFWAAFDAYELALVTWLAERGYQPFDLTRGPDEPKYLEVFVPEDQDDDIGAPPDGSP